MCEILIRPYEPRDFERLTQIHDPARQNELALAGLSGAFVPLRIAAEREGLFEYTVLVAEQSGAVAGFVAFTQDELAWLYVDTALSRRGVGRSLMRAALAQMADDVAIEVLAGNAPELALYRSFGFEVKETLHGKMPGNEAFDVTVHVLGRA